MNKVAIITGASRGIGRTVAIGLAKERYIPILISRTKEHLEDVAKEISEITEGEIEPIIYAFDITDSHKISEVVQDIKNNFKRIDILVNNAGVLSMGTTGLSKEELNKTLETNLVAPFLLMNEVVSIMQQQKAGYIFNVASRAGKIGFAETGIYSASKFGLVGYSESLYRKLAPFGIKVTSICPSWVDTKMAKLAESPLDPKEMIQPKDIMETINWLLNLSDAACVREIMIECQKTIA